MQNKNTRSAHGSGFPPACCSYLLTVSRNGCLSTRRFRASERPSRAQFFRVGPFFFHHILPNTAAKYSYTSSLFDCFYHTAAGRKSPLFFAPLFAQKAPLKRGTSAKRLSGLSGRQQRKAEVQCEFVLPAAPSASAERTHEAPSERGALVTRKSLSRGGRGFLYGV